MLMFFLSMDDFLIITQNSVSIFLSLTVKCIFKPNFFKIKLGKYYKKTKVVFGLFVGNFIKLYT